MARYEHIISLDHVHLPQVLLVPGLNNSGPDHWQTRWESELPGAKRVQLGKWDDPVRNHWVNQLNLAIHKAGRPVILVAHSLGCHAVAWWAEFEQTVRSHPVVGALLVAPPDVESAEVDPRLRRFGPLIQGHLPFRSLLVASEDDPYAQLGQAKRMARKWGSQLINAGPLGHINADSGIGSWPYGKFLLRQLLRTAAPEIEAACSGSTALHRQRWVDSVMANRKSFPCHDWGRSSASCCHRPYSEC
ncbi:MAG: esterase [Hyphomonas sp.]|uniref:RBBP9/YdeN family alpha/beta hydrolase n=1 Tax=Hyphomonas sp. TaxID=87 RepID=UPI001DA588BF|nr:alpha/beta hydrolase [Hyphomonas sp.]MBA4008273.1 esterase [Erythrobacter sp.]MBA4046661.1 esterase [Erythrobacter sp.]MBA4079915.1 esterase [Erythrobacter sp.]MBA4228492.1 esterase [Hyphomonas sp.]